MNKETNIKIGHVDIEFGFGTFGSRSRWMMA